MLKIRNLNLIKLFRLQSLKLPAIYVLIFAIFIVANVLLMPFSFRADLSYGRAYSLAPATEKILRNLDDIVTIKFFASSDLPSRLIPLKNDVTDLLNEYQRANQGKVHVSILDPKTDSQADTEAKADLPQLQFSQLEQDKYAVTASYFGIVLSYGGKKEVIPQVTDLNSLEYNLTASIYKLTNKSEIKIAVMGKTQSFDPNNDDLASFKQTFQKQFTIDYIDVSTQSATTKIDPSYKTVLVFDTDQKKFDEKAVNALKDYIQNKGKVIFFVDGVWVDGNLNTMPSDNNLFSLLDSYGIRVNTDLVLSNSAQLVNFGNSYVSFLTPYPFWVKATQFSNSSSYFSNITQLTYPWVSSLSLEKRPGITDEALVKTTKTSWDQSQNYILDPQQIPNPQQKDLKQFIITALAKNSSGGEVLVIPSSRFILQQFLGNSSDNLAFVLNAANDFASQGALAGINQRQVTTYPLPELSANMKNAFKYLNILLLPVLCAAFGAVKFLKRR